jgi:histidyl-tRNA synthetase
LWSRRSRVQAPSATLVVRAIYETLDVSERIRVGPVSGFPEWTPAVRRTELRVLDAIRASFELHGFMPIETPAVERMDVLTAKGGMQRQIYSLRKPSEDEATGAELGLHFDLTVPLARYVAQRAQELTFPFRRYQMQKVWRGERAQRGRFREFYQCDIDIIGSGSLDLLYDAEIVSVIASVFRGLALPGFEIRLSNRRVLSSLISRWGIEGRARDQFLRIIDKHGSKGPDSVANALTQAETPTDLIALTQRLLAFTDLDSAERLVVDAGADPAGVRDLKEVADAAWRLGVRPDELRVDLSIARGLDYYTGTVYETFLNGHEEWGSVCSGGRYDDLAGYFTNQSLPGVGVSIGLTRLLDLLVQSELFPLESPSPTRVFVAVQDRTHLDSCLGVAAMLRKGDIPTEVYMQARRLGEQLSYASALGIPLAVIIGASEVSGGYVTVRDLRSAEQTTVPNDEVLPTVLRALQTDGPMV